ncbi:hypothetical protein QTP88_005774 [Uroleucon formosanum]
MLKTRNVLLDMNEKKVSVEDANVEDVDLEHPAEKHRTGLEAISSGFQPTRSTRARPKKFTTTMTTANVIIYSNLPMMGYGSGSMTSKYAVRLLMPPARCPAHATTTTASARKFFRLMNSSSNADPFSMYFRTLASISLSSAATVASTFSSPLSLSASQPLYQLRHRAVSAARPTLSREYGDYIVGDSGRGTGRRTAQA